MYARMAESAENAVPLETLEFRAYFKSDDDVWPTLKEVLYRDDKYVTVTHCAKDNTYSLTYHVSNLPTAVTTNHFTTNHAVLALRDVGYSLPRISEMLETAYQTSHTV